MTEKKNSVWGYISITWTSSHKIERRETGLRFQKAIEFIAKKHIFCVFA